MTSSSVYVISTLVLFLIVVVGGIALQIFLSRRESRAPGLILPALTLVGALAATLVVVLRLIGAEASLVEWFVGVAVTFLVGNIPTIVLLGIYFGCREKFRRKKMMDRMNIQDLE
ncbi:MAG: hypothetical protein LUC87_09520 [Clostridiales bacterium]|nr:hypothetical protein [Clostridiales bacterium]